MIPVMEKGKEICMASGGEQFYKSCGVDWPCKDASLTDIVPNGMNQFRGFCESCRRSTFFTYPFEEVPLPTKPPNF